MSTPTGTGRHIMATPSTTSELNKECDKARAVLHSQHDELVTVAAEFYAALCKSKGHPLLLGIDVKIKARRVVRHLIHAAEMQLESGRAVIACWTTFHTQILGAADAVRPGKSGFDPTK
jgi:hypothetical protein